MDVNGPKIKSWVICHFFDFGAVYTNTNLPALDELNYKKRTLYCGIAQNSCCRIDQNLSFEKRNRAILREMTFANDSANCCVFAQN